MPRTVIADGNMSMRDLVIQGCGSRESMMLFCRDNGVSRTEIPVQGQSYIVSDAAIARAGTAGAAVVKYLQLNEQVIGTLGPVDRNVEVYADEEGNVYVDADDPTVASTPE